MFKNLVHTFPELQNSLVCRGGQYCSRSSRSKLLFCNIAPLSLATELHVRNPYPAPDKDQIVHKE